MNTFITWCYHHRDFIIFSAIALSAFAGYATAQDIMKGKILSLKAEILELKREIWDNEKYYFEEHPYGMSEPDEKGNTYWITNYDQIGGKRP